ncbi:hypothetical protein BKA65DRAFT_542926 [Rhexocercosporidium sp. MPI-PUGE-AT-0058]|nr:hypothetical protein BKA65DRAFT_542926 [Rhexocercosporidium sp. MPI-PUGE-AT-0058]
MGLSRTLPLCSVGMMDSFTMLWIIVRIIISRSLEKEMEQGKQFANQNLSDNKSNILEFVHSITKSENCAPTVTLLQPPRLATTTLLPKLFWAQSRAFGDMEMWRRSLTQSVKKRSTRLDPPERDKYARGHRW